MNVLAEYLKAKGRGATNELAEQCKCSPSSISDIARGRCLPSLQLAIAISEHTEIPVETWKRKRDGEAA